MKRFYISILLLFSSMATYGQIKVVDDSYKTETAAISEMNKPLDMEKLEEIFPKYEPRTPRLMPREHPNAVGEKFYVCEESEKQYVRINPTDSTVCIASMPAGYYEITGIILTSDRLNECREEALRYKINQNERESIIVRMSSSNKASIANLKNKFLGLEHEWDTDNYLLPIWICKDSIGRLFYVSPAYLGGGTVSYCRLDSLERKKRVHWSIMILTDMIFIL